MNPGWKNLVESLRKRILKTLNIIEAFEKIDRKDFVTEDYKNKAYIDEALPIGRGQTISQPYTVAFMLELLRPQKDEKILDIGAGSGWQTALLAEIVGKKGKVFAVEIIPELCQFGQKNILKYKLSVDWFCKNAEGGLAEKSPFDKIIVAASLESKIPEKWLSQLKNKGRLVIPIKNSIWLYVKRDKNNFEKQEYPGFAFVPFV